MRDARFCRGNICPRCGQDGCARWGRFQGRQRYRCHACRRTYSDLTGTPAAYSKRLGVWWKYATSMQASQPLRRAAALTGIHLSTSFRWRHRILAWHVEVEKSPLAGWTEVASEWFRYSEKGRRKDRTELPKPRRRDPWPDATTGVNVLIAADRVGNIHTLLAGPANARRLYLRDLEKGLRGVFEDRPMILMPGGWLGPGWRYAELQRGDYVDARGGPRINPIAHMRTTTEYRRRLLAWIRRFRGVATKYLPNYLAWHRIVDSEVRNSTAAVLLRWPATSGFL